MPGQQRRWLSGSGATALTFLVLAAFYLPMASTLEDAASSECACHTRRPSSRVHAPASIDQSEVDRWLADYSVKRAHFYIGEADRLLDIALIQIHGDDEKQNDPYVKIWEAWNNVLAALDLAPRDGVIWVKAGLRHLRGTAYHEEKEEGAEEEGLAMIRTGLRLAKAVSDAEHTKAFAPLEEIKAKKCREGNNGAWKVKKRAVEEEERDMYTLLCKRMGKLKKGGRESISALESLFSARFRGDATTEYIGLVDRPAAAAQKCEACPPTVRPPDYLDWARSFPSATSTSTSDSTSTSTSDKGASSTAAAVGSDLVGVRAILDKPENRNAQVFSTPLLHVNFADFFGAEALERLGRLAADKYNAFAKEKRGREGEHIKANDINDDFFTSQFTAHDRFSAEAIKWWPELYQDSPEYKKLITILEETAIEFALRTSTARDYTPSVSREQLRATTYSVVWAAVYPEGSVGGGRHGAHAHQATISSCVFYAVTGNSTAPIAFYDPRGEHVHNDYERYETEFEWQPKAPFHQPLWVFPEVGDLICFPSWLIHSVPTKLDASTYRVAFPINLQVDGVLDSWHMTATST